MCKGFKRIKTFYWKMCRLSMLAILSLLSPNVFAEGGESPVGEGLGYVINNVVYGKDGEIISIIAVAAVGIACLAHKLEWMYFFILIGGIAFIFGAPEIVSGIKALIHQ